MLSHPVGTAIMIDIFAHYPERRVARGDQILITSTGQHATVASLKMGGLYVIYNDDFTQPITPEDYASFEQHHVRWHDYTVTRLPDPIITYDGMT